MGKGIFNLHSSPKLLEFAKWNDLLADLIFQQNLFPIVIEKWKVMQYS